MDMPRSNFTETIYKATAKPRERRRLGRRAIFARHDWSMECEKLHTLIAEIECEVEAAIKIKDFSWRLRLHNKFNGLITRLGIAQALKREFA